MTAGRGIAAASTALVLTALVACGGPPEALPRVPTPVPLEPSMEARVDSIFRPHDSTHSPGCAVGVVEEEGVTFARGYGMADLAHRVPIDPRTVFDVASVSKQFTAAVALLLEREGALSLDEDIRVHLPELPEHDEPVTVRSLLHHTSGFRDYLTLLTLRGVERGDLYTADEVYRMLIRQESLNFLPGEAFLYSNTGYFLISRLVPAVTGRSLREYADEELFRPLGMERTHFMEDPDEVVRHRATGYAPAGGSRYRERRHPAHLAGDGGLLTSVEELAKWEGVFLGAPPPEGDPRRELVSFLRSRMEERGRLADGTPLRYSYGLTHGRYRRLATSGHSGSFLGFRAEVLRFPGEATSVAVLCNVSSARPWRLAREVAGVVLEDAMGPPEPLDDFVDAGRSIGEGEDLYEPPARELEELAGDYHSPELDVTYRIRIRYGSLRIDEPRPLASHLVPEARDTYRLGGVTFRFIRGDSGEVEELRVDAGRALDLRFEPVSGSGKESGEGPSHGAASPEPEL